MTELEAAAQAVGQKVLAETDIYVGENDEFSFQSYSGTAWHSVKKDEQGRAYVTLVSDETATVYRVYLIPEFVGYEWDEQ